VNPLVITVRRQSKYKVFGCSCACTPDYSSGSYLRTIMSPPPSGNAKPLPIWATFVSSAIAACTGEVSHSTSSDRYASQAPLFNLLDCRSPLCPLTLLRSDCNYKPSQMVCPNTSMPHYDACTQSASCRKCTSKDNHVDAGA